LIGRGETGQRRRLDLVGNRERSGAKTVPAAGPVSGAEVSASQS